MDFPGIRDDELLVIPTPRRVERLGAWVFDPRSDRVAINHGLAREGYRLTITGEAGQPGAITIEHADDAGLRHARATLTQLRSRYGDRLPALRIEDWPTFATRGVMIDISRDRVPTMDQLCDLVDRLALLKANHLQLYTEHTFAYAGHEDVWQGWSPMTPAEVRELDDYASARGVQLVANQNCFGHLAHWLRMPKYQHLAETHGDWMFDVWPRSGPFSLCPTDPRSIEFVRDLLTQLLPNFSTKLVNIGCDETYDIAYGRSKDEVARRGRAAVYLDFVQQVCDEASQLGYRPMFWADIALHEPTCIPQIPQELISLAWNYEPDAPFAEWCRSLSAAGREVWVCPGTSSWRSITGRTSERTGNITAAARDGAAHGATGLLMCDWGDTGHHQTWPITMFGLAHGLASTWNHEAAFEPKSAALHAIGSPDPGLGLWLQALGDADLSLRQTCGRLSRPKLPADQEHRLLNQSALFIDLHNHSFDAMTEVGRLDQWTDVQQRVGVLAAARPNLRLQSEPPAEAGGRSNDSRTAINRLNDELSHTLAVAQIAADRGVMRRRPEGLSKDDRAALAVRLRAIMAEHARQWPTRSRHGGLEHSLGFYQKVLTDLER